MAARSAMALTPLPTRKPSALVVRLDEWQASNRVVAVANGVARKYAEDGTSRLAAGIAFYAFFSLFPLMLAFTTVLGFVLDGRPDLQESVVDSVIGQFPVIGPQIESNVGSLSGNGIGLAIGLVAAIWSGLRVIDAVSAALNVVFYVPKVEQRGFVARRVRGAALLAGFGVALVAATVGTSTISAVAGFPVVGRLALWAVSVVLHAALVMAVFLVIPADHPPRRQLMPGAVVGGAGFFALASFGGFYLSRVVNGASDTYGLFAVVIGLLTWMLIQSQLTLAAATLNVVLAEAMYPRRISLRLPEREGDRRAATRREQLL
jgi:membrane protein